MISFCQFLKLFFLRYLAIIGFVIPLIAECQSQVINEKVGLAYDTTSIFSDGGFEFLITSDWGRDGLHNQLEVAAAMAKVANSVSPKFIVSCGDNFQIAGVSSVADLLWQTSFENVYNYKSLMVDWYPVLGNHDYKGNTDAEIQYSSISKRWKMFDRYYTFAKKVNDSVSVRFIFIDTPPLVDEYYKSNEYPDIVKQDTTKEMGWLRSVLADASEKYILVFGHHPVYSASPKHGNTPELIAKFKPLFERYNVTAYFCGHDHDFQHLKPAGSNVDYFVTGVGSEVRKCGINENSIFSKSEPGFVLVSITGLKIKVTYISINSEVLYSVVL